LCSMGIKFPLLILLFTTVSWQPLNRDRDADASLPDGTLQLTRPVLGAILEESGR
jgi:hypothetical protein